MIDVRLGRYCLRPVVNVRQDDLRAFLGDAPGVYVCNAPEPAWYEAFGLHRVQNHGIEKKRRMFAHMGAASQWLSMTCDENVWGPTRTWRSPSGILHLGNGGLRGRAGQLAQAAALVRWLVQERRSYAYIYAYNFDQPQYAACLAAKTLCNKRLVVDYEDDYTLVRASRLKNWLEQQMRRTADAVVCVNERMQTLFPRAPSIVVNTFADLTYTRHVQHGLRDGMTFLFSGRLDDIRGVDLVPSLVTSLRQHLSAFKITITGSGPLRDQVRAWRLPEVHYAGFVSDAELERLTAAADVCLILQKPDHPFSLGSYPSKIETYARSQKPVYALEVAPPMKQVVQNIRNGRTNVHLLPDPVAPSGAVVVANTASLISAGTERYVIDLAKKSLLGKARQRPDHVRRVLQKLKQEGAIATATQVWAKLNEPMALGYATAGVVLECGRGVQELKPGDRVATAGPHAGIVAVGRNLCARVPDGVSLEDACYAAVGAIALQGLRLARPALGERVLVVGLGLIGQMVACLARAHGCQVFGVDIDADKCATARALGCTHTGVGSPRAEIAAFSEGQGVDSVIITAATESNEPLALAADACRVKGRIVCVGVTGMNVPRAPFMQKELQLSVSSSLGPGRGDPAYEEKGIDYPVGYARWTAGRNMSAVLGAIASGALPVDKLTTHRFPVERAAEAYELITSRREPFYGVVLTYPDAALDAEPQRCMPRHISKISHELGVSIVGAGNYARLVMLPTLARLGGVRRRGLVSARGLNAQQLGATHDFAYVATDVGKVLDDAATDAVFIATRHDLHAELVTAALRAGKHVFVEKPLCIRAEELDAIDACIAELGDDCPVLMVGFNRRFTNATRALRQHFAAARPLSVSYRFASASLPADAWPHDEDVGGGRIVGEACHAIDWCTHLIGAPPIRVYAESVSMDGSMPCDDRVFITLRHADGSIANVSYQSGGDRAGPTERIEVFGGGRTATLEGWQDLALWRDGRKERARRLVGKGHSDALREFIKVCKRGGDWPIRWDELRSVAWASLAAVHSIRSGAPVDVAPLHLHQGVVARG